MASALTLDQLAADINARLERGDKMFVSAAAHLAEARERVEAGEAGDQSWEDWYFLKIRTPWEELTERLSAAERRELLTAEVAAKLVGEVSRHVAKLPPKSHKSTGVGRGAGGGRPKAATTKVAEERGVSVRTVQRAVAAKRETPSDRWRREFRALWSRGSARDLAWARRTFLEEVT